MACIGISGHSVCRPPVSRCTQPASRLPRPLTLGRPACSPATASIPPPADLRGFLPLPLLTLRALNQWQQESAPRSNRPLFVLRWWRSGFWAETSEPGASNNAVARSASLWRGKEATSGPAEAERGRGPGRLWFIHWVPTVCSCAALTQPHCRGVLGAAAFGPFVGGRGEVLSTMARRPRSSRAWHFVLSAARRDADARAVALAGTTNWGYDSDGQHSDSDSDPEYSSLPPSIPSAVPVTGESFCDCEGQNEATFCNSLHTTHRGRDCRCGEEDEDFDWVWDDLNKSSAALLSCDNRKVSFHVEYSCGTAAIRGTKELGDGQHFWEIKMTSPVYGTDMGSIIGVHLDTWHGTLTFFKNRKCIGVAATRLQNRRFYPMVCSTAAKSSMKVIRSCASSTSLQYLCCYRLRQLRPNSGDTLEGLPLPPGLKQVLHNKLGWVLSMNCSRWKSPGPPSGTATTGATSPETRPCQRKRCRRS
ncbi:splA/ryanodine receptor domain and SOCS box containing 3 [Cricetulus griseus]